MDSKQGAFNVESGSPMRDLDGCVSPDRSYEDVKLTRSIPRLQLISITNNSKSNGDPSYQKTKSHGEFGMQCTNAIEFDKKLKEMKKFKA